MATFSERLKNLRGQKRITQRQLAEYLGMSKQAVTLWERGVNRPSPEVTDKIAEYFGVEYGYLIGSTDNTEIPAEQGELGVERDLELKKVRDLQDATQKLCRLTDESVRIIKGTINEAFRIDREKGMLKDKDAYSVSIRSKMLEG